MLSIYNSDKLNKCTLKVVIWLLSRLRLFKKGVSILWRTETEFIRLSQIFKFFNQKVETLQIGISIFMMF